MKVRAKMQVTAIEHTVACEVVILDPVGGVEPDIQKPDAEFCYPRTRLLLRVYNKTNYGEFRPGQIVTMDFKVDV